MIKLGKADNAKVYSVPPNATRKQKKAMAKRMDEANNKLIDSIRSEGAHLKTMVTMVDGLNDQDKAEQITEGLYNCFDELTR